MSRVKSIFLVVAVDFADEHALEVVTVSSVR